MKEKINEIIFGTETRAGKNFDLILLVLIVFSILIVLIESVPEWRLNYGEELHVFEWIFTILFTIEYLLRVIVSPNPWKYIKSFWGLIDLISILPTFLSLLPFIQGYQSLRVVRAMRLLRIFRIFSVTFFA